MTSARGTADLQRTHQRRGARRAAGLALVLLAPVLAGCGVLGGGSVQEPVARQSAGNLAADASAVPTSPASTEATASPSATPTRTTVPTASRSTTQKPAAAKTSTETRASATIRTTTEPAPKKQPAPARTTAAGGSGSTSASAEAEVLRLVNVERGKAGCKAVTSDATLVKVARAHSRDMAEKSYFSHDGKDGRDPFQRMRDAGYRYSWAAENIAAGQASAASVMTSWMNSTGHRENILNCKLTELGVGMWKDSGSTYRVYWTQDFGTPR